MKIRGCPFCLPGLQFLVESGRTYIRHQHSDHPLEWRTFKVLRAAEKRLQRYCYPIYNTVTFSEPER